MTTPNLNDVLPILDINGGVSGKPILRKATLSSIFSLIQLPEDNGGISSGLAVPNTIKTTAENSDYFIGIDDDELPYKISKSNLLASVGGGGISAYPHKFTHWHDESVVVSGGAITFDLATAYKYFTAFYQPSNAIGDSFKFDVFVDAGTYDISFLGRLAPNLGIASLSLNGTLLHSDLDFYGGGTIATITRTVTIITSGINTFTITAVGKNASSSGYYILLTKIWGIKV